MSQILTNNKHYSDIADTIRQMKDVDTTYKPREMASALKDIYSNEVEGTLPLSFQANGMPLIDYRIDGASGGVGDRTSNLYNSNLETNILINALLVEQSSNDYKLSDYIIIPNDGLNISGFINLQSGDAIRFILYDTNKNIIERLFKVSTVVNINNTQGAYLRINYNINMWDMSNLMVVAGTTTPLIYEPYGYKVPAVVSGKNLFNENSELNVNASINVTNGEFPNAYGGNRKMYFFKVKPNTAYTFSCNTIGDRLYICEYNQFINPANYSSSNRILPDNVICNLGTGMSEYSFTTSSNSKMVGIYYSLNTIPTDIQIEIGNIATDYETYIEPTTTNIYLDEPISQNESISLSDTNVDIPTIEGTNVITIDTTVQPNNVYVQARKDPDEIVFLTQVLEEEI